MIDAFVEALLSKLQCETSDANFIGLPATREGRSELAIFN